jgi:hypothetical protein
MNVQEAQTELPTPLLLFGYRKRYQNTGMVHAHCPFIVNSTKSNGQNEKSIFYNSSLDKNLPDKPFGYVLGNRKLPKNLCQKDKNQKQKPCHSIIHFLIVGVGFSKCKKFKIT